MKPLYFFLALCSIISLLFYWNFQSNKQQNDFVLVLPKHFPPLPTAAENPENPLSKAGVELGRKLFYDKNLSGKGKIACVSCHQEQKVFSDGIALSAIGESGKALHRHTPSLANVAWAKSLFWDGGANNLESLSVAPLTSADEMNQDLKVLVEKLSQNQDYIQKFGEAFPNNPTISTQNILRALAQFQRTLIAANSRYDDYLLHKNNAKLTSKELFGLALVQKNCMPCHATVLFTDHNFHNNGLDTEEKFTEENEGMTKGRARITSKEQDKGKYKTPSLRNVMRTAPYMHDGRFASIEQVLEHYTKGVKKSATLSPFLSKDSQNLGIRLSENEKQAIIAFLHTLTDH
jgi:cytochrome c peroxidase